ARGVGEGTPARLAGPRGDARAGALGGLGPRRATARRRCRERGPVRGRAGRDPHGADAQAAAGSRRGRPRRRADRRPRGAARLEPQRALQDAPRRTPAAAGARRGIRTPGGGVMTGRDLDPTLLRLLGGGEPEIDCDECFAQLDRYVELELAGAPADELVPGLRAHLVGCPACAEEHESLRALLELDSVS